MQMIAWGGKLDLTRGVMNVRGCGKAAGGGMAEAWGADHRQRDQGRQSVGEAYGTYIGLTDYSVREFGGGLGFYDRGEVTVSRQTFDTGATGAKLGLGKGFTFRSDGGTGTAKLAAIRRATRSIGVRIAGCRRSRSGPCSTRPTTGRRSSTRFGGKDDDSGVDYYVAATKILLDQSLVLNGTLRETRANQFGFLGFGGDKNSNYTTQFEGSAGYLVNRRLLVGAEYRTKPDNLGFAREQGAYDLFAAFAITHNLSATAAYVDLGDIATFRHQRGVFISLQAGF